MKTIRAIIIDDSAVMRQLLKSILSSDSKIEVVATARDPYDAREKIKALRPDVLTLDVEMPRMNGITFLENLMRLHPVPTVMISTLTGTSAETTMKALELGAFDVVAKPAGDSDRMLKDCAEEIIAKVKQAATTPIRRLRPRTRCQIHRGYLEKPEQDAPFSHRIIAIGSSTGGTEAVKDVLLKLPKSSPGIVVTQHIPPKFSQSFAERLDNLTDLHVREATDGAIIRDGHVFVAPGGSHLEVLGVPGNFRCRVHDGQPVNHHKPSVDVLFASVRHSAGRAAIGVILTGMGKDGAIGLRDLRAIGCSTIVQDKETSVVWGMPGAAIKLDAAEFVLPLQDIADQLTQLIETT